ncbi:MAG: phosphate ABC transporter substrate-binding protein PstS [Planctomycetes bacterium]|nr:phosphate ABC transporter substrate-binding protein PstS [Planctomycetota bacterium]
MLTESTAADFLTLTEASRLLTPERLKPYRAFVGVGEPAMTMATRLVRDGMLTPFQAKVLLKGRPQGFFLTTKYKILDHLGTGGMGRVYLCEHLLLHRLVAVKVLGVSPTNSANASQSQGNIERFYREAQAVAALDHKNIARVFDVDQTRGAPFMVMEYLDGVDLSRYVVGHGALDANRAADYVRQAAEGLQHAHEAGLVHRDIKPSNLILDRAGVVKVLDLGLARFLVDSRRNQGVTERYDSKVILGTADFMAPEQAVDSSRVDIRADIYSLGCSLYFLLTGKMVFDTDIFAQKMMAHQMQQPVPIRKHSPQVPAELEAVVARMMEKKPQDRYQTPAEVAAALVEFSKPTPAPPDTKSMPKLAANSFRLGLCPQPTTPSTTSSSSSLSVSKLGPLSGSLFNDRPPSTVAYSAGATPDSGAISVAPASDARRDTPAVSLEPTRKLSEPEPERRVTEPQRKRSPKWTWIAGGVIGSIAVASLAVLSWPESRSTSQAPPPVVLPLVTRPTPPTPPDTNPTPVPTPVGTISGAGSSFARPIMDHWTGLYKKQTLKYASVGSSKGIEGVIDGSLQFGCTDAPMTAAQLKQLADKGRDVRHIPIVLGAVVPIYNLPELGPEKLTFTGPILADIYLGRITHWDDEAILINNPMAKDKLTHRPITVTHRSDGSGTTFIWTDYLSAFSAEWMEKAGKGASVKWPLGKGAAKSDGVTDLVNSTTGAIGYVELSHALQLNLRYGLIKNRQGTVVPPTFENVTAAAASLGNGIPDDLVFSLVDRKSETAYPITGATWALLPMPKEGKPDPQVVDFLEWATHEGQKYTTDLRYAPLSKNFSDKLDALFYRLKR